MPHRTLNLEETADYLHLSRRDLDELVKRKEIPFCVQGGRTVFRKAELDVRASRRILGLSGERLADYHRRTSAKHHDLSPRHAMMPELITGARIDPALQSRTKGSTLRAMVALAERTELLADSKELLASLEEREALCSTALSSGIALLHPRQHDPYMFVDSFIVLGRSIQAIHAGSMDGQPTDLFFLVCCQDDRTHLHVLARLCTMCQETHMVDAVRASEDAGAILAAILAAEKEVIRRL